MAPCHLIIPNLIAVKQDRRQETTQNQNAYLTAAHCHSYVCAHPHPAFQTRYSRGVWMIAASIQCQILWQKHKQFGLRLAQSSGAFHHLCERKHRSCCHCKNSLLPQAAHPAFSCFPQFFPQIISQSKRKQNLSTTGLDQQLFSRKLWWT